MTSKLRTRLILSFILAFPFVLFCFFFYSRLAEIPPAPPTLPSPNGYDDLVKADKMLARNIGDYDETNIEGVRSIVASNAAALMLAREGLSNQCRVPVQYSQSYISNHLEDLGGLKQVALGFIAEGRLAEMENRPADAAQSYLDIIHLGNEVVRGGVLIDELVGIAIEAMGTSHLQSLLPQLDTVSCRSAAATLEALDSNRETWDQVTQDEKVWSRKTLPVTGWWYRLDLLWETHKATQQVLQKINQKFDAQVLKTHRLMIDLAAREYELDKGKPPAQVADLVPEYLKAVPKDPVSGTAMGLNTISP